MKHKNAFSLVEVALALGLCVVLAGVVYEAMVSGSKGIARGEDKLEYAAEAGRLFKSLKLDADLLRLRDAAGPGSPAWNPAAHELTLEIQVDRKVSAAGPSHDDPMTVSYKLVGGSIVRIVVNGAPPAEQNIQRSFGHGKVTAFDVGMKAFDDVAFCKVSLGFHAMADAPETVTEFSRIVVLQHVRTDRTWKALDL